MAQQRPLLEQDAGWEEPRLDAAQPPAMPLHTHILLSHHTPLPPPRPEPVGTQAVVAPGAAHKTRWALGADCHQGGPEQAGDRQGTQQTLPPGVTEASEPQGGFRYHFIMTKATSHVICKVHHYYPLSTNHRHKPGLVQMWPKWRRALSWEQSRGGAGRAQAGAGIYKHCSRQSQTPPSLRRAAWTAQGRTDRQPVVQRLAPGSGRASRSIHGPWQQG